MSLTCLMKILLGVSRARVVVLLLSRIVCCWLCFLYCLLFLWLFCSSVCYSSKGRPRVSDVTSWLESQDCHDCPVLSPLSFFCVVLQLFLSSYFSTNHPFFCSGLSSSSSFLFLSFFQSFLFLLFFFPLFLFFIPLQKAFLQGSCWAARR